MIRCIRLSGMPWIADHFTIRARISGVSPVCRLPGSRAVLVVGRRPAQAARDNDRPRPSRLRRGSIGVIRHRTLVFALLAGTGRRGQPDWHGLRDSAAWFDLWAMAGQGGSW